MKKLNSREDPHFYNHDYKPAFSGPDPVQELVSRVRDAGGYDSLAGNEIWRIASQSGSSSFTQEQLSQAELIIKTDVLKRINQG